MNKDNNCVGENKLTNISTIHNHSTRLANRLNFFVPRKRTCLGKQSFSYNGPVVWQNVPNEFKKLAFGLFKQKFKKFLLEKYEHLPLL